MSLFSMADLHLSLSTNKPMDIFGARWKNHAEKIEKNWKAVVGDGDTVVVPGDISWALSLEEAEADLRFIDRLPGKKLLGKGNHDYWWSTMSKLRSALAAWELHSIDFLYNNAFPVEEYVVCGTRGWYIDEKQQRTPQETDYAKIVLRETGRLELSLREAAAQADELEKKERFRREILVYLHFPPVFKNFLCREIVDKLREFGIRHCYFGHIHGVYTAPRSFDFEGITFTFIAADFLNFIPMITMPLDY